MRVVVSVVVAAFVIAAAGCDPPIALAEGTTLDVALPIPALTLPPGAPAPTITLEAPGRFGELRLAVDADNVARARVALTVAAAEDVFFIARVTGGIVDDGDDSDDATLLYAEKTVNLGPGSEVVLDAVDFASEPSAGRLFLDVNRNGVSNRDDVARGCDPGVPAELVSLSTTAVQVQRGGRDVVFVENTSDRAVTLRASVIDGDGFGVAFLDVGNVAVPAPEPVVIEPGALALVAVDFNSDEDVRSDGLVVIDSADDVAADACGVRVARAVRVVGNASGRAPAVGSAEAAADYTGDVEGVAAIVPDGSPVNVDVSAGAGGSEGAVDGAPSDVAFVVEVPAGGRLAASLGAAIDVDLHLFALGAGDAIVSELPHRPGDDGVISLAGDSIESADVVAAAHAAAGESLRVLVVVGAPGTAEPRAFGDNVVVEGAAHTVAAELRLRVTEAPRLATIAVPDHGPVLGGTTVSFSGDGLDDACQFFFGSAEASCIVSAGVDGRSDVACATARGSLDDNPVDIRAACASGDSILGGAFTYDAVAPLVDLFAPAVVDVEGGAVVTVTGFGFGADTAIFVDDEPALADVVDITTLRFVAPPHDAGAVDVRVALAGLETTSIGALTYDDNVIIVEPPVVEPAIVAVTPDPAHALTPGERLTVLGQDLITTNSVRLLDGITVIPAHLGAVADTVVVVFADAPLPAGTLTLELGVPTDAGVVALSVDVRSAEPAPISVSADGPANEGDPFTLLVDGSLLNPGALVGARLTPLDAASGSATDAVITGATEDVVALDVAGLGRGGWQLTLIYEGAVEVPVDIIEVGGVCPGAALCEQCGDGLRDPGEQCDGTDFGGQSCGTLGFDGGSLSCVGCAIDANSCARCGNGVVEDGEACDGASFAGATCVTAGFAAGAIACSASCDLVVTGCATCGDRVCSGNETSTSCAQDCPATCGDGTCQQGPESCSICARDCGLCGPYQLLVTAGADQHVPFTQPLPNTIDVRVVDAVGAPVPNVVVSFSVDAGDTVTPATVRTDATGNARASARLGLRLGAHAVHVSAVSPDGAVIAGNPVDVAATADDVAPGTVVVIAGNGTEPNVNIDATGASFANAVSNIAAVTIAGGDIVFMENRFGSGRLNRIDLDNGVISTITRSGAGGGDGGPLSAATLSTNVFDVAGDVDGTVYVLQPSANGGGRVRRITPDGFIDAFAGGAVDPPDAGDGDGGPATNGFFATVGTLSLSTTGAVLVPTQISNAPGRVRTVSGGVLTSLNLALQSTVIGGRSRAAPGATLSLSTLVSRAVDMGNGVTALSGSGFFICSEQLVLCDETDCRCNSNVSMNPSARGPDGLIYGVAFGSAAVLAADGLGGSRVVAGAPGITGTAQNLVQATATRFNGISKAAITDRGDLVFGDASFRLFMIRGVASTTPPAPRLDIVAGDGATGAIFHAPSVAPRVRLTAPITQSGARIAVVGGTGGEGIVSDDIATDVAGEANVDLILGRNLGTQRLNFKLAGPAGRLYPTATATLTVTATALPVGEAVVMNARKVAHTAENIVEPLVLFDMLDEGGSRGPGIAVADDGTIAIASTGDDAVFFVDGNGRVSVRAGLVRRQGGAALGVPANTTNVFNPSGVVFDVDGSLVIAQPNTARVIRVRVDGIVENVAGNGFSNSAPVVGVDLDDAFVIEPQRVAIDPDGHVVWSMTQGIFSADDNGRLAQRVPTACNTAVLNMFVGSQANTAFTLDGPRLLSAFSASFASCTNPAILTPQKSHIVEMGPSGITGASLFETTQAIRSLAMHPDGATVFAVVAAADNTAFADHKLVEIDLDTDVVIDHTLELGGPPWAIAFDSSGVLYAIDRVNGRVIAWKPR